MIDHPVGKPNLVAADIGLDAADEMQILSEYRRLLDHAFGPK